MRGGARLSKVVVAAAGVVALGLAAGCSGGDEAPPGGSGTTSVTSVTASTAASSSPTQPTTSTAATEVQVPPAATKHTAAGAEAFARYYMSTYSAAARAGNADTMRGLAQPSCEGCAALLKVVQDFQSKGQRVDRDAIELGASQVTELTTTRASVSLLAEEKPKKILDAKGAVVANVKGARFDFRMETSWQSSRWLVTDLRVVK